eukprot:3606118-Amphidinium_carterae.1
MKKEVAKNTGRSDPKYDEYSAMYSNEEECVPRKHKEDGATREARHNQYSKTKTSPYCYCKTTIANDKAKTDKNKYTTHMLCYEA